MYFTDTVRDCQQVDTGTLFITDTYILGLPFNSCSKDEIGRKSVIGTTVLLKFDSPHSLGNYVKSVYYIN